MKTPTDEDLLADHLRNEPLAFELLVRRHSGELHRFVHRFTNSSVAADDVVQDTFLQAYVSADRFDATRRFKPWLFTIAANKARDWLRSRNRHAEVPLDAKIDGHDGTQSFADLLAADHDDQPASFALDEERKAVRRIVDGMPLLLREVLVLAYFHRFAYKDIADVLGIPVGTVKSRLHAAVAHFGQAYRAACDAAADSEDHRGRPFRGEPDE